MDQITQKQNGYLAHLKDAHDLAEGIRYCVSKREYLGDNASDSAVLFSSNRIGQIYLNTIEMAINKNIQ